MFQPQATPYFSLYGVNTPLSGFAGFQPAGGSGGGGGNEDGGGVDSGGPTVFQERIFSPVATDGPSPLNFNLSLSLNSNNISALPHNYQKMNGSDLDAQEALAREYNPTLGGPLVGEKRSSRAIAEEYAKADPIYVAKTAALPQKYSHYRPVLGDGNCGWRAAGFSYFETLLRLQNKNQLEEEVARMISLNNLLTTAGGFEPWLFEDMVEETTNLLRAMADLVETSPQDAEEVLWQRFNNPETSNSIVYHLRLLASSWLKADSSNYQGFIPDGLGVNGYRKNCIEPVNQEIDHLGMTLLIDVLLKPIGFAVEVVYLDRSPGSQANSHVFQTEDANGIPTDPNGPMIYLLYRPSHYDILYKDQATTIQTADEATRNINVQVQRAANFSQHQAIQGTPITLGGYSQVDDMALLSCIPGFSLAPQPSHHGLPSQFSTQIEDYPSSTQIENYPLTPISASISPVSPGASLATTSSNAIPGSFPAQPQQPPPSSLTSPQPSLTLSQPFPDPTTRLPIHTHVPPPSHHGLSLSSHASLSAPSSMSSELSSPSSAKSSFRPSIYEWEAAADWHEGPVAFQTSTFRNSHYNTAHYNNPNFQPEAWTPESEDAPVRKRSS